MLALFLLIHLHINGNIIFMKRNELEKKILEQHPELLQTNLKVLLKPHLESLVDKRELTLSTEILLRIFSERNERARINQKLNNENFGLRAKINAKIKEFVNIEDSEILQAGQWLLNSLSKVGKERQESLLDKDLVHKDDYNNAVTDLKDTIEEQRIGINQQTNTSKRTINDLQETNDSLRKQLSFIQDYITNNYSHRAWSEINRYIQYNL